MSGPRGDELERLAARFNASQAEYRVAPRYKGTEEQTLALALGSRRSIWGPHIVQAYEAGTADLLAQAPRIAASGEGNDLEVIGESPDDVDTVDALAEALRSAGA